MPGLSELLRMFPHVDKAIVATVLRRNEFDVESTLHQLLRAT